MSQNLVSRLAQLSPAERRALLQQVQQRRGGSATGIPRLAREAGAGLAASFAQERLWFLWRLAPDSPAYHVPWCYQVTGPLDVEVLAASVDALVRRFEVLRTTLREVDGRLEQLVGPAWRCERTVVETTEEQVGALATEAAERPFDLTTGPLLRVHVWRTGPGQHVVLLAAHHVILDEWSLTVLERELWALYRAGGDPAAAGLPALDIQYADYAGWQRGLVEERREQDLAYWRQALEGATPTSPAPDRTPPETTELTGDRRIVTVPTSRLGWLERARGEAGTTDYVVLFALYCLFLARHSGSRDVTVGTPVSGRSHADTANLVGFFVNTLALRVRIEPDEDFPSYLKRVRATVLDGFAHQELPFEQIVRAVAPQRAAARNPLFHTMFSYASAQTSGQAALAGPSGLDIQPRQLPLGGSHFDLSLVVAHTADGLTLGLDFSTELYDGETVERYLDSLTELFEALAADPRVRVADLLRPSRRELALLDSWNDTRTKCPDLPVHELLRAQARRTPDAVAIEADDTQLTFRQLDTDSDHLAHRLHHAGIRPGHLVGISLRPSASALTAVWAVWKAGAAFLPLDPDLPAARLNTMIEDAQPALLVTDHPIDHPHLDLTTPGEAAAVDLPAVASNDLAYVMYTSGSTGRPKGVMIDHGGLTNHAVTQLIPRVRTADQGRPLRVVTGTSAFISDFFLAQLLALLDGHTLVILTPEQRQDPRHLVELAQHPDRAIGMVDCTTSQAQLLLEAGLLDAPHPPSILVLGGEACPPDLWTALRAHPRTASFNAYGPTEATVDAAYLDLADSRTPVIGSPHGNTRIHLLDQAQQPVVPGTMGEIYIGGPGVGRGYLNRPDTTADTFLPDPWGPPGTRLYRTGDLARHRTNGHLEYHGRNDHQIKILGQRIEPEDVETALRTHPHITNAAISAHQPAGGGQRQLVAHLVLAPGATLDRQELRAYLAGLLPKAAVPTLFVTVEALPVSANGKLDRKALHVPDDARTQLTGETSTAPRTETERRVAAVWCTVLGLPEVGVHDDFFALGGHSLLASRLVLKLSTELDVELPLHQAFTTPTVAGQATWIDEHRTTATASRIPRQTRRPGQPAPASHAQERMWFLWRLAPNSPTYHVPWNYQLTGPLNLQALNTAINTLIQRHETLRTTLQETDGTITQTVQPPWQTHLTAEPATPEQAHQLASQAAARPFDLTTGPLLRAHLWQTAPDQHLLLFTAHHVILDEWSLTILERELWTLYRAEDDPAAAGLPALDIQYADYANWQRGVVEERREQDLAYWRQALEGATPTSPVPDHTPPEITDFTGDRRTVTIPDSGLSWLDEARTGAGATDYVVLFAVYCLFLARHSGSRDVTVGTPVSGRSHADTANLVGFFVNTLALRVRIDPDEDFPSYLKRVRATVLDGFAHQELPFEQIVRAVAPQRAAARNPLFRTMFSYGRQSERTAAHQPAELSIEAVELGTKGSHFDLTLGAVRTSDGLALSLDFSTELYDGETVERYLDSLTELFEALAADPATTVADLLRPSRRELALLDSWNDTRTECPDLPVHELLRAQTRRTPDAVAIEADETQLTFRQLDTDSDQLAHRLHHAGIRPGHLVGISLRPGAPALTAVWAIWKAGAAFLPLDPDLPAARLNTMIEDAQPALLITDHPTDQPHLDITTPGEAAPVHLPFVEPHDLAYVMYTSGSTGRPKGVMIEHGGLTNHVAAQLIPRLRTADQGRPLRVLTGTSAFISDFFLAQLLTLLDGHSLVILTPEQRQAPRHLVELAQHPDRAIGMIECTTSQAQLLLEAGLLDAPHPPRVLIVGGEACPPDLWNILRAYPRTASFNAYGPTEATVDAAYLDLADSRTPVIGSPYGNTRIHLLDQAQQPVVPGTMGEIYIGGPGVGRGYLNRPDTTADTFLPDPWGPPGTRLYRTGDLARHRTNGHLEYHGRNDHQIKILGQRIEPEDVETALRTHPHITNAAISAHQLGEAGPKQLVAHLVAAEGTEPSAQELRTYLAGLLPKAAVPTLLLFVDALPLTTNGKLDRKALHIPDDARSRLAGESGTAPRTETERRVAEIWAELLNLETVGVHDDFFALGGHSLLASRLVLKLSTELDVELPLHQAFTTPTVAGQASWIDEHGTTASHIPHHARQPGTPTPASHAQERMWFLWRLAPNSPTYHIPWNYQLTGPLNLPALNTAINTLIQRHETLRTTLQETDGTITQTVQPPWHTTLTATPATPEQAHHLASQATAKPFDLTTGPLLRAHLWQTAPDQHLLLFTAHHVILDEWSLTILERELWTLYQTHDAPDTAQLPHLDVQYADYANWQRDRLAETEEADLAYWRETLTGATPTSPLPDHTPPAISEFSGAQRSVTIPAEQLGRLAAVRAEAGATDYMTVFALYCLFLARHSGSRDVTVGTPVSGRSHADTANLIGLFVNTLALRVRIDPDEDFPSYLKRVRATVLDGFAHQELPFEQIVRAVAPQRAATRNPLFHTMFSYNQLPEEPTAHHPAELAVQLLEVATMGSHFDLTLGALQTADGLSLSLDFSTELYDPETVEGYLESLTELFDALATDPATTVADLLRPSRRELALLDSWNDTRTECPDLPVHELLRAQARRTPDAVAIDADGTQLTFRQLDTDSDQLAHRLHHAGIRSGHLIGISLRPGAPALTAVWAIWKAGAAFLPLDPDLPTARLTTMIEDAQPALLITDHPTDQPHLDITTPSDAAPVHLPFVEPHDLAYLIYTSGSTGRPKGVMIDHHSLTNHTVTQVLPRLREAGAGDPLRVATGTSAFISDFFLAQLLTLLDGHTLVILTPEQRQDPRHLVELAQHPDRAIGLVDCTTSQLHLLVEAGILDAPHPPRLLIFGGEACPPDLWAALRAHPHTVAFNAYGPTEATIDATYVNVADSITPGIGTPHGNTRIHLLDQAQQPVVPGTVGEIYIGGPGVGRGYLNRPDTTADTFLPDPWGPPGTRLYRTGDLARHRTNGHLEYHGRNDHQIKILGQRIEPEDVETALRTHPHITNAAISQRPGHSQLVAHLVTADGTPPSRDELRAHLTALLPAAAVPTLFLTVEALPVSANGKLDRKALRIPEEALAQLAGETATAPRTETERRIAAVWCTVLGLPEVGVHDDFFTLGGHSLLAVRLAAALRSALGTELPLAQLVTTPTVAGQAAYLDALAAADPNAPAGPETPADPKTVTDPKAVADPKTPANPRRPSTPKTSGSPTAKAVVAMGGTRGAQPLVLVHPLGGTLFCYLDLIAELGTSFEVLGVQGDLLGSSGSANLGESADRYARELAPFVMDRHPVIAGWSAGGVIAHELAVRLERSGIVVDRLVLIDADPRPDDGAEPSPNAAQHTPDQQASAQHAPDQHAPDQHTPDQQASDPAADRATDLAALDRLRAEVARHGPGRLLADPAADRLLHLLGVDAGALSGLDGPTAATLMGFWRDMLVGLADHRPARFGGRAELIVSLADGEASRLGVVAAWRELTGRLHVTPADGDHYQLLQRPWVKAVADTLRNA